MEKLYFYFSPQESQLEARFHGGHLMINDSGPGTEFNIRGYYKSKIFTLEICSDIYEALDKANEWYKENVKKDE